eukprot:15441966-Alexandrium_andersonii.AAC.1
MRAIAHCLLHLPPDEEPLRRPSDDRLAEQAHGLRVLRYGAPLVDRGLPPPGPGGVQVRGSIAHTHASLCSITVDARHTPAAIPLRVLAQ